MQKPGIKIVIGHGSGSFGHSAAAEMNSSSRGESQKDWSGFHKVWWAAHQLNHIVANELINVGLPAISLPASAALISNERKIQNWMIEPILLSLKNDLIPVVFGDVVFDQKDGFVIHSTERLFSHLARQCHPDRILLVGKEKGVYSDYPANQRLIPDISPQSYESVSNALAASFSTDVTGGMATKVKSMLELVQLEITLLIDIFSGEEDNNLFRVIMGERIGTRLSN